MTTNRKFEKEAMLRSRIALLVALVIHFALLGFFVFNSEDTASTFNKAVAPTKQALDKPRV